MRKFITAIIASCLIFIASSAMAAPTGFELQLGGDFNVIWISLTNTGNTNIEGFEMTIGATYANFDFAQVQTDPGVGYTLVTPDTVDYGVRSDAVVFSFTNFTPGSLFEWTSDVDPDSYDYGWDSRYILFNNGADPNSVVTVTFAGGKQLIGEWPDAPITDSYTMSMNTPVPAAVWLLGSGLVGLVGLRRKMSR